MSGVRCERHVGSRTATQQSVQRTESSIYDEARVGDDTAAVPRPRIDTVTGVWPRVRTTGRASWGSWTFTNTSRTAESCNARRCSLFVVRSRDVGGIFVLDASPSGIYILGTSSKSSAEGTSSKYGGTASSGKARWRRAESPVSGRLTRQKDTTSRRRSHRTSGSNRNSSWAYAASREATHAAGGGRVGSSPKATRGGGGLDL